MMRVLTTALCFAFAAIGASSYEFSDAVVPESPETTFVAVGGWSDAGDTWSAAGSGCPGAVPETPEECKAQCKDAGLYFGGIGDYSFTPSKCWVQFKDETTQAPEVCGWNQAVGNDPSKLTPDYRSFCTKEGPAPTGTASPDAGPYYSAAGSTCSHTPSSAAACQRLCVANQDVAWHGAGSHSFLPSGCIVVFPKRGSRPTACQWNSDTTLGFTAQTNPDYRQFCMAPPAAQGGGGAGSWYAAPRTECDGSHTHPPKNEKECKKECKLHPRTGRVLKPGQYDGAVKYNLVMKGCFVEVNPRGEIASCHWNKDGAPRVSSVLDKYRAVCGKATP